MNSTFSLFKLYLVEYIMIIRFSISISRLESKFKILDKISIADPIASNHKIIVSDFFDIVLFIKSGTNSIR